MRDYCGVRISTTEDLLNSDLLQFPLEAVSTQKDYLSDLQKPIIITIEELQKDLYRFQKDFPKESLPNVDLFNYDSESQAKNPQKQGAIKFNDVLSALKKINSPDVARLIGLVTHFAYWSVLGHINQVPLDEYHKRQLFISITKIQSKLESSKTIKKIFTVFTMPMILLAVRVFVDYIFRSTYVKFYEEIRHDMIMSKLLNDVITIILDPNMYYSRFSFFESEKDAMKLTYHKVRSSQLPKINSKIFTRSALVKSLFPVPSEGKVRAMFGHNSQENLRARTTVAGKRLVKTNISTVDTYADIKMQQHRHTAIPGFRPRNITSQASSRHNNSIGTIYTANTFRGLSRAKTTAGGKRTASSNQYDNTLNMINKVQMFQIAATKVNKNLIARKKPPIFTLKDE